MPCCFVGVQRGETREGVLRFLGGDQRGEVLRGVPRVGRTGEGAMLSLLVGVRRGVPRVGLTGEGAMFSCFSWLAGAASIGLITAIFPLMGLIADLALTGCFLMGRVVGVTKSTGMSRDLTPGAKSKISHSSLSASAVLLIAFDFKGMQYIELISSSFPRLSSTSRHLGRPLDFLRSGPKMPSWTMGARWHHFKSGM